MDNKKKTDSIMRYVVYLLCGVLLAGYSLLKWNAMSEMKYLYLAIGVIWVIYGGVRALVRPGGRSRTGNKQWAYRLRYALSALIPPAATAPRRIPRWRRCRIRSQARRSGTFWRPCR